MYVLWLQTSICYLKVILSNFVHKTFLLFLGNLQDDSRHQQLPALLTKGGNCKYHLINLCMYNSVKRCRRLWSILNCDQYPNWTCRSNNNDKRDTRMTKSHFSLRLVLNVKGLNSDINAKKKKKRTAQPWTCYFVPDFCVRHRYEIIGPTKQFACLIACNIQNKMAFQTAFHTAIFTGNIPQKLDSIKF